MGTCLSSQTTASSAGELVNEAVILIKPHCSQSVEFKQYVEDTMKTHKVSVNLIDGALSFNDPFRAHNNVTRSWFLKWTIQVGWFLHKLKPALRSRGQPACLQSGRRDCDDDA